MSASEWRLTSALVAFVALVAACGGPAGSRGVRVEDINTDIGLGVEVNLDAAPANTVVRRPIRRDAVLPPARTIPPFETAEPDEGAECPAAGPFDFAAVDAGVDPDPQARPFEGSYRWKLDGKVVTDQGQEKVDEFETRRITDVEDDTASPQAFRFTMAQTRLLDDRPGEGTLETTYRVVPTGQARNVPNPPVGPGVSDTGRGLYLVSIFFTGTDDEGEPTESRFEPTSPLLLLPFPVTDGTEIDASGTDPQTGMQVSIVGAVNGKKQIDTCGKRVDSWFVNAEQTIRVTDPQTLQTESFESDYDYGVGPQFGSMLLYERIEAPKEGPIISVAARIAEIPKRRTDD